MDVRQQAEDGEEVATGNSNNEKENQWQESKAINPDKTNHLEQGAERVAS